MGSFKGHVVPGTLFLVVGLWHMWCSVYRYVRSPNSFRIRVWNPVPGFDGRLKYLELYLVVIGAFIDLCIELVYAPHLKYFVNGVLNPSHMNNFEHSGMLIMFFIFGLVTLISVKTSILPLPDGALTLIAATAFSSEYLLFYFHSTNHKGLEGYYHYILVVLIGLCVLTSVVGTLVPSSFPLDLSNSIAITLQGLWFYQTAFTLYGPMMPDGCVLKGDDIVCHSTVSLIRGEMLANFQLFSMVIGVFGVISVLYSFASSTYGHSSQENLQTTENDL
ncbi:transmembrane protein 45A-like [Chenopodium quinoa]|uniref:Transmembrane protein 45B n=1 Tax=Chenopodium quinoa TaxID=63459 RepID=A0A803L6A7_CHEQI|nr:transmembrane protein 45A-like [Chenopodium quinoa]XP_021768320.1 transmembrane protein 45A-like [Chenopodium quinoa]XP_021768321.1 transmembrane protein 45A-like [Chenopodium quinoa]XP_021768322.1 transmembrane protein 45A-like [Chenopodium quinoa]